MRRLILRLAALMITFGAGLGIDRLVSRPPVSESSKIQDCQLLPPLVESVVTVTPTTPPPVAVETPNAIFDYDTNKFYPDGSYSIIGAVPKEFRNFSYFNLEWLGPVAGRSGDIYVSTGHDEEVEFRKAIFGLVTKKRIFWASPPMGDGFEYRFEGEFLNVNFESAANTNRAVLRGTLTKTKDGRKVAERVVSFRIEYDSC